MELYLIRHAEAVPVGGAITRDADRPLSSDGEAHAQLMSQALARVGGPVALILTSPLVRARQTGEIIGAASVPPPRLQVSENLSPGIRASTLYEEIVTCGREGNIVAVGHQPDLTTFLSWLVADATPASLSMPPAAMAGLSIDVASPEDRATLRWLLTPAMISRLL